MRFTERFLILLALISIILRLSGSPQSAAMQLISFPALALFYLLFTPSLLNAPWREHYSRPAPARRVLLSIAGGIVIAYCIMSALYAGLGSFPVRYAVESALLGLILFGLSALLLTEAGLRAFRRELLLRGILLCALLALAALLAPHALPRSH